MQVSSTGDSVPGVDASNGEGSVVFYQTALEHVRYEGELLWLTFEAFLLPQTIFLAFLVQSAFGGEEIVGWRPAVFVAGAVGLLLCFPWAGAYKRRASYCVLRMAQAREAEPLQWRLLKTGERFAQGRTVEVGGKPYRIGLIGRALRTARSAPILILVFGMVYLAAVALSGPWWQ